MTHTTTPSRQLSSRRQAWVTRLQDPQEKIRSQVLACYAARGLATLEQVERLTDLSYKQVRLAIEGLSNPGQGLPSLLRQAAASLFGRPGRPERLDLLTADGQAVLRELMPEADPTLPELADPIELAHAYIEMELYTLAKTAGRDCDLERVFPLGGSQYIRADVVIGGKTLFEVEQVARALDVPRIQDKLLKLISFYSSPAAQGVSPDVRVLFNVPNSDGNRSLETWQAVLAELEHWPGKLPFRLFFRPILEFLQAPDWDTLEGCLPIEPKAFATPVRAQKAASPGGSPLAPVELLPPFLKQQVEQLPNVDVIMGSMKTVLEPLAVSWTSGRQDPVFFETMRTIYEASHFEGGPVRERAEAPILSLVLLYRYLRLSQQSGLLKVMQQAWVDTQRGMYHGVNLFRDAYTRLCWLFLRRHGYGPGGPLEVRVIVPSFDEERSDVYVEVDIANSHLINGDNQLLARSEIWRTELALAWVLEALWSYGEELGLKPKPKKKGE